METLINPSLIKQKSEDFSSKTSIPKAGIEETDEFNTKIEILVELDQNDLRPFVLSDCYATDRAGMQLEILPKIIFDTVEEDLEEDSIDLPKPIFRQTIDYGTQASIRYKNSRAQTERRRLVNSWCQCEPRLFSQEEKEEHFTEESFSSFLTSTEEKVLNSLLQNQIADVFTCDLSSLCQEDTLSTETQMTLKMKGSFSSPESNRMISSINWHVSHKDIFVVSTLPIISFEERTSDLINLPTYSVQLFIWSARNQFSPKLVLSCFDEIKTLSFSPYIPNLIAGGTLAGQLVLWDIKEQFYHKGSSDVIRWCVSSNLDHLHVHGITHLEWVPSFFEVTSKGFVCKKNSNNASYQIATSGLDGILCFWDLRLGFPFKTNVSKKFTQLDEVWEPFHSVKVFTTGSNIKSLTCFSFRKNSRNKEKVHSDLHESEDKEDESQADFYAGCDDGTILCGNFQLMKDDDGKYAEKVSQLYESPHSASVCLILSSPFLEDVFMSAGGKSIAIWKHEIKSGPILLRERGLQVRAGQWSPTRAAVFIVGLENGSIEVWDLLKDLYEPTHVHYISTSPLRCLAIHTITEIEHVVAVGDLAGVVYTITLPPDLVNSLENELNKIEEFLKKEASRINEQNVPSESIQPEISKKQFSLNEKEMIKVYEEFLVFQEQQLKLIQGIEEEHNSKE